MLILYHCVINYLKFSDLNTKQMFLGVSSPGTSDLVALWQGHSSESAPLASQFLSGSVYYYLLLLLFFTGPTTIWNYLFAHLLLIWITPTHRLKTPWGQVCGTNSCAYRRPFSQVGATWVVLANGPWENWPVTSLDQRVKSQGDSSVPIFPAIMIVCTFSIR